MRGWTAGDAAGSGTHWITVHARGAEVAIAVALGATLVAFLRHRSRRDLVVGSAALVVLLILEAFIGGEVYDHPGLQAVRFPLALALMALAVWLPLRVTRQRWTTTSRGRWGRRAGLDGPTGSRAGQPAGAGSGCSLPSGCSVPGASFWSPVCESSPLSWARTCPLPASTFTSVTVPPVPATSTL